MYAESEVDTDIDFMPKDGKLCERCKFFEECPLHYVCKSLFRLIRWEYENLDDDDSC